MTELSERTAAPAAGPVPLTGPKGSTAWDPEYQEWMRWRAQRTPGNNVFAINPDLFDPRQLPLSYLDDLSGLAPDEFRGLTLEQLVAAANAVNLARDEIDGIEAEVNKVRQDLPGVVGAGVVWSEMTAAYLAVWE